MICHLRHPGPWGRGPIQSEMLSSPEGGKGRREAGPTEKQKEG